jgi:hypothetical protein
MPPTVFSFAAVWAYTLVRAALEECGKTLMFQRCVMPLGGEPWSFPDPSARRAPHPVLESCLADREPPGRQP